MPKYRISLMLLFFLVGTSWSQEELPADESESPGTATAEADEILEESVDDEDLDEQIYEEDDDDFVPTEEIPADEPIPFPSNI